MKPEQEQRIREAKADKLIAEFKSLITRPRTGTDLDKYNIFLDKIRELSDEDYRLYQVRFLMS